VLSALGRFNGWQFESLPAVYRSRENSVFSCSLNVVSAGFQSSAQYCTIRSTAQGHFSVVRNSARRPPLGSFPVAFATHTHTHTTHYHVWYRHIHPPPHTRYAFLFRFRFPSSYFISLVRLQLFSKLFRVLFFLDANR
jgi:hypothetical protein